jgi:PAS domain S-box-containing protein
MRASRTAMLTTDAAGCIDWVNAAAERALGRSAAALLGRPLDACLAGGGEGAVSGARLGLAVASRTPFEGELAVDAGERRTHWRVQADPVIDDRGTYAGAVVVLHDVTALVEARRVHEAENRRLSLAVAGTGYGVWEFDPQSGRLFWDEQMYSLYGHTGASFDGSPEVWRACLHPEDRATVDARFADLLAGEVVELFEFRAYRHSDGELRYVEANGCCEFDHAGAVSRLVGMNRDVTDLHRLREVARLNEERWKFALEGSGDGVWDWDLPSGRIALTDRCREILGEDEGHREISPERWEALIHPEDRGTVLARSEAHLTGETSSFSSEYRLVGGSVSGRWVLARGMVVQRDAQGAPLRVVGTLSDVTGRRLLEERLRQAQKLEVVGQLAGGIAHDFNNILSAMMLRLETLRFERLPPTVEEGVSDLDQMARRAAGVTRQLLAFARRQTLRTARVELSALVGDLVLLLRRLIGDPWKLETEVAAPGMWVRVDGDLIAQAIVNLCLNARDAMAGGGTITIYLDEVDRPTELSGGAPAASEQRFARVRVRDQGQGMDAETKRRLFEPFFTTKALGKGTGLGLASVYGTVQQHGGWIEVETELGVGSVFSLYLPTVAAADPAGSATSSLATRTLPRGDGITVLVVEDEDNVRVAVESVLRSLGYSVWSAADGPSALRALETHPGPLDVLLTDLAMPGGIDGLALCERVRALRPQVRTILMTGGISERIGAGFADVALLRKPFQTAELAALLAKR